MGEGTPDDLIRETGVENLWLLPAGAIPPNPAELLGSQSCRDVLKDLAGRFDRVILDSPPIAAVTDAVVLAPVVDGVILIARSGQTPRDILVHAYQRLKGVQANLLGVVVSGLLERTGSSSYSYRYPYYRSSDAAKASKG